MHAYGTQAVDDDIYIAAQDRINNFSNDKLCNAGVDAIRVHTQATSDRLAYLTGVAAIICRERVDLKRRLQELPAMEARAQKRGKVNAFSFSNPRLYSY